ncbi:MAG: hypothetical protein QOK25_425, partial [Thermoleophilaceae bacterium]|nr:hypothetical protein [Thermoleophilaceae bacterium]
MNRFPEILRTLGGSFARRFAPVAALS